MAAALAFLHARDLETFEAEVFDAPILHFASNKLRSVIWHELDPADIVAFLDSALLFPPIVTFWAPNLEGPDLSLTKVDNVQFFAEDALEAALAKDHVPPPLASQASQADTARFLTSPPKQNHPDFTIRNRDTCREN